MSVFSSSVIPSLRLRVKHQRTIAFSFFRYTSATSFGYTGATIGEAVAVGNIPSKLEAEGPEGLEPLFHVPIIPSVRGLFCIEKGNGVGENHSKSTLKLTKISLNIYTRFDLFLKIESHTSNLIR